MKPLSQARQFLVKKVELSLCLIAFLFMATHTQVYAQPFPDFQVDLTGLLMPNDPRAGERNRVKIQQAIDNVHGQGGGTVNIPSGHFYVMPLFDDPVTPTIVTSIQLKSHVHIVMKPDTILHLQSIPRPHTHLGLFEVVQKEPTGQTLQSVQISGGHLIGPPKNIVAGAICDKEDPNPMRPCESGIMILGDVKEVVLQDITISGFTLDGGFLSHRSQDGLAPTSVRIRHVYAHDNKRNGISIVGGDHILVKGGSYRGNQLAGIDVENESGRPIHHLKFVKVKLSSNVSTDPNLPGSGLIIQKGQCPTCSGDFTLMINDVVVRDCVIDHNSGGGIVIIGDQPQYDPTNLPFRDLKILRNYIVNNKGAAAGISIRNATRWNVRDNHVSGNRLQGISARDVSQFKISANMIVNNGDDGIVVRGSSSLTLKCVEEDSCVIQRNEIIGHEHGINLSKGTVRIRNNRIDDSTGNGVTVGWATTSGTEGSKIANNKISDSTFHGITVGASNAEVVDNIISRSGLFGIHVEPTADNSNVKRNNVSHSQRTGIHVGASGTYLRSNLIENSGLGGMFDGILFNHLDTVSQLGGNSVFNSSAIGIHVLSAVAGIDESTIAGLNAVQGSGIQDVLIGP